MRHRKIHSDSEKRYRCEECNFAFWEKSDLQRHIRSHVGNRPFKCNFCEQTFTWKRYLLKHLNIHHKDDTHHFCIDCCACFESEVALTDHIVEAHSNKKQLTHTCSHCGEEFYFKYKLDEHMFKHTGIKAHKCEKCTLAFVSRRELERHIADHSMEVSFHCNTCDQTFASIQDLQTHVTLHAGRGKFVCSECNLSFKWKSQLKAHMVSHSDNRAFSCDMCEKEFKRMKDLRRHVRIYHESKPPYTCTECNQDFHSPLNLLKHEKSCHSEAAQSERFYECHQCSGAFKLKEDLDRHMKIHQSKPYICMTCSKEFSKLKFIKKHLLLKHNCETAVELEHYRKIKPEGNENEDDGIMDEGQDLSYDAIHDVTYDGDQEPSYIELQTVEQPEPEQEKTEEVQRIEIVPLSSTANNVSVEEEPQTQIIIESVQGGIQSNMPPPTSNIASNVTIPKVIMIRGNQTNQQGMRRIPGMTNQNMIRTVAPQGHQNHQNVMNASISNTQYTQQSMTSQSNANRLSTESILLQLAQTAQMQKPMPAQPQKLPSLSQIPNIVTANQVSIPQIPNIVTANQVPIPQIPNIVTSQAFMPQIPNIVTASQPTLSQIPNIVTASQGAGDYVNDGPVPVAMIPSVVNTSEVIEEVTSSLSMTSNPIVQVEVMEGEATGQEVQAQIVQSLNL